MTEQFAKTSLGPPTPCPGPRGRKRIAEDTLLQDSKRVRSQYEDLSTAISSDQDSAWTLSIETTIRDLRKSRKLCNMNLDHCLTLLARSENWKCFSSGFPALWISNPGDKSGKKWPRHLVFILHHQDHWTVVHLDKKYLTLHKYNSLPGIPVDLTRLQQWITREFSVLFWSSLRVSDQVRVCYMLFTSATNPSLLALSCSN